MVAAISLPLISLHFAPQCGRETTHADDRAARVQSTDARNSSAKRGYDVAQAIIAIVAAVIGWLTGMLTLKRSSRWCTEHGTVLRCDMCSPRRRSTTPGPDAGTRRKP